jgi:hypothetical protein
MLDNNSYLKVYYCYETKTKKQTTPTPPKRKKGSYDTTQGARVRLLMLVKTFSLGIVTSKKILKIFK